MQASPRLVYEASIVDGRRKILGWYEPKMEPCTHAYLSSLSFYANSLEGCEVFWKRIPALDSQYLIGFVSSLPCLPSSMRRLRNDEVN